MSQKQIDCVTSAAVKAWADSESPLSYADFIFQAKARGAFWGAREAL